MAELVEGELRRARLGILNRRHVPVDVITVLRRRVDIPLPFGVIDGWQHDAR